MGFEGLYKVSNMGRVKSCERIVDGYPGTRRIQKERILAQSKGKPTKRHPNPYYTAELWKEGKRKRCSVARLVAIAFIPNPKKLPQVNHIDGDRNNNTVSNLEWCTAAENCQHAWDNGLISSGTSKPCMGKCKKTGKITEYESIAEAARQVGGNPAAIRHAIKGRTTSSAGYLWKFKTECNDYRKHD